MLSGAALAYEVLLIRLFSIVQWHHFAYLVISVALLGIGASGTVLALVGTQLARRVERAFGVFAAMFGISAAAATALAMRVPFNALELPWHLGPVLWLLVMELTLAVPFLFVGLGVGLALIGLRERLATIYGADLIGAGCGAAGGVALLAPLAVEQALMVVFAVGAAAGIVALMAQPPRRRSPVLITFAATATVGVLAAWPADPVAVSEFKPLSQSLRVAGAVVTETRSSALARLTVVENARVPLRHAPGLSLSTPVGIAPQVAVFVDGDGPSVITRASGSWSSATHLDYVTSALPFHLLESPSVLVLGAGAGEAILQAMQLGARSVDAVEPNRQLVDLLRGRYREFAGHILTQPQVRTFVGDPRAHVESRRQRYDLIQVTLRGSYNATGAGLYALRQDRLHTVEAIRTLIERLAPGGRLALTHWIKLPPRDGVRLMAIIVQALQEQGMHEPAERIGWIRSWSTGTLVVGKDPLSEAEVDRMRQFAATRSFDAAYYPRMPRAEANRLNRLQEPYFYDAARALLGPQRERFLDNYKFNISPATDDRPYFFNFFKWRHLPELLSLRDRGGAGLLELGYLVLIAALIQALPLSLVLIVLPLWRLRSKAPARTPVEVDRVQVAVCFSCLGLAFLFIEITFIAKLVWLTAQPVYAAAAVLAGFLLFAGWGSSLSARLVDRSRRWALAWPVAAIVALCAAGVALSSPVMRMLLTLPDMVKLAASVGLVAPLALFMGMPFALVMGRLADAAPTLLPWGWSINGCASVISAVLATVLAMQVGHDAVIGVAAALYVAAACSAARMFPRRA